MGPSDTVTSEGPGSHRDVHGLELFDRVLCLVEDLVGALLDLADRLIRLALTLQLLVACESPRGFLDSPLHFV
jgi:hypothetical protein